MGQETEFKFEGTDEVAGYKRTLYLPKPLGEIGIGTNSKVDEDAHTYKVTRNDTSLTWDKDDKNNNGLFITVSFRGQILDDSLDQIIDNSGFDARKYAAKVDDTGSLLMPSDFFDEIPKNALLVLTIVRANVDVFEKDGILSMISCKEELQRFLTLTD